MLLVKQFCFQNLIPFKIILCDLMQGKTVIAIAHRLSTIAAMDRLVVIDEGNIVEEGDHQSLLKKKGLYYQLWQHQSGGFIAN